MLLVVAYTITVGRLHCRLVDAMVDACEPSGLEV